MKHHQNKILLLIICLTIVLFNSCGMIYLRAIGVKPFKLVNEEQLISYLSSQKVSIENIYQIDMRNAAGGILPSIKVKSINKPQK